MAWCAMSTETGAPVPGGCSASWISRKGPVSGRAGSPTAFGPPSSRRSLEWGRPLGPSGASSIRVAVLKTLALIIAALGMALVEPARRKTVTDDDEDVGLFVGSAHALPARPPARRSHG